MDDFNGISLVSDVGYLEPASQGISEARLEGPHTPGTVLCGIVDLHCCLYQACALGVGE